ncbi:MAG: hypothetical protein J6D43_17710, partial [Pseudomonas sp.]|nr:hypothetical protein [Pseudomonas sp.]
TQDADACANDTALALQFNITAWVAVLLYLVCVCRVSFLTYAEPLMSRHLGHVLLQPSQTRINVCRLSAQFQAQLALKHQRQ